MGEKNGVRRQRRTKLNWTNIMLLSSSGLALFPFLTARAIVAFADGPTEKLYGFPLFWIKAGSTSLSVLIDVRAMVLNVAIYVLAAFLIVRWAVHLWPNRIGSQLAQGVAWITAVEILVLTILMFKFGAQAGG